MEPTLPWYQSAILRQQIAQVLVALTAVLGFGSDVDWNATVGQIFAGVAGLIAVWTFITRLVKPAPNITQLAADRERELVSSGKAPARQGGFARPLFLLAIAGFIFCLAGIAGCGGTVAAYRSAKSLPDTAYVMTEHYAALVRQAADIAENPATPASVKQALQIADRAVKPFILGDEQTRRPGLQTLAERYQAVRDATTEAELQDAIDNAARELSHFINAVKSARSQTRANLTTKPRTDRHAWSCLGVGTPRSTERGEHAVCVS